MSSVPAAVTRNRINQITISTVEPTAEPYVTYDEVALCNDPNCPVCRAQRSDRRHKHHHQKRHHHKQHKTSFWNNISPRTKSASSVVSVQSIILDERRTNRAIVPVDRTERQIVPTTRTKRIADEEPLRDAWAKNPSSDDEIVCCRAVNGCHCPCWCCILLIIPFIILIIILIVLLATLL